MRAGWRFSSVSLAFLLTYAVISLILLRPPLNPARPTTAAAAVNDNRTKDDDGRDHDRGRRPRIQSAPGADSIVFIALGPAARSTSLLYALSSLREEGQWDGAVHVIVEHEDDLDCLSSYLRQSVTAIAIAPPSPSGHGREQETTGGGGADERASPVTEGGVFKGDHPGRGTGTAVGDGGGGGKPGGVLVNDAKMAKMKLLDLLPPSVERVVYVDCDVITQKPLGPFLDAISQEWNELDRTAAAAGRWPSRLEGGKAAERSMGSNSRPLSSPPPPLPPSTLLIFEDAGGHTVPVCRGCDRAHSGVVALARGHSERCLELWHDAFQGNGGGGERGGGGTATDQEALDVALREGSGCRARWIGRRHLSFMKDAFVMAGLTRRSTFGHFTGLLHPQGLGAVYRRFYEWALGRGFGEWGQGEIESCAVGV